MRWFSHLPINNWYEIFLKGQNRKNKTLRVGDPHLYIVGRQFLKFRIWFRFVHKKIQKGNKQKQSLCKFYIQKSWRCFVVFQNNDDCQIVFNFNIVEAKITMFRNYRSRVVLTQNVSQESGYQEILEQT